jgi:hypothetical protein
VKIAFLVISASTVGSAVKTVDGEKKWFTVLIVEPKTRTMQKYVLNADNL